MKTDKEEKEMESLLVKENEVASTEDELRLSELSQPVWSVISFEKCLKSGLTYDEALEEMNELTLQKVSGLCIVTDETAERI